MKPRIMIKFNMYSTVSLVWFCLSSPVLLSSVYLLLPVNELSDIVYKGLWYYFMQRKQTIFRLFMYFLCGIQVRDTPSASIKLVTARGIWGVGHHQATQQVSLALLITPILSVWPGILSIVPGKEGEKRTHNIMLMVISVMNVYGKGRHQ